MNDDTHLNLLEHELANELAYLVADKLWRDLGDDTPDGEVYNIGQSNYEAGCRALNFVGVYQQGRHYTLHKVIVPVDRVKQHMVSLEIVSRNALELPWLVRRQVDAALKNRNHLAAMKILKDHWDGEQWLLFPYFGKARPGGVTRVDLRVLKLLLGKLE